MRQSSISPPPPRSGIPPGRRGGHGLDLRRDAFDRFLANVDATDVPGMIQAQRDLRRLGFSLCLTERGAER